METLLDVISVKTRDDYTLVVKNGIVLEKRAEYGQEIIKALSDKLISESHYCPVNNRTKFNWI